VVFDSPAGRLLITETVISNDLPEEYIMRYDGQGYVSYSNYSFEKLSNASTLFILQQDVELERGTQIGRGTDEKNHDPSAWIRVLKASSGMPKGVDGSYRSVDTALSFAAKRSRFASVLPNVSHPDLLC
jgi:hypothetical protein